MTSSYANDRATSPTSRPDAVRAVQQGELCEPIARLEHSENRLRTALMQIHSDLGRLAPSPEIVNGPPGQPAAGLNEITPPGPLNRRLRTLDSDFSYLADRAEAALKHLQTL